MNIGGIGLGSKEQKAKDVFGRVLVAMLAPYKGRIFDPGCGSGGMFVQSEKFVEAHGGKVDDIAVYGPESNPTTWKLARMNLAIRGIASDLGKENADSFLRDLYPRSESRFHFRQPAVQRDVSEFSPFVLRSVNAPTAITLQGLQAYPATDMTAAVALGLLVASLVLLILARKQKRT